MQRITETVSKNSLFPLTEAQGEGQRPAATARGPGARPEAQPPPQPPPPPLTLLRERATAVPLEASDWAAQRRTGGPAWGPAWGREPTSRCQVGLLQEPMEGGLGADPRRP